MATSHQTPGVKSSAAASASMRPGVREHSKRPMFDTLQVANDLKKGGFAEPQAEALVSAFSAITRDLVTKADLKAALKDYPTRDELKAELKAALEDYPMRAELKAELKAGLSALQARLAFLMILMSGVIVGAVGLIVKL